MKRSTPLARTTPLRTRTRLSRVTPVKPVSAKQRRRNARWAVVRDAVLERDGLTCQRCGRLADDVHHRRGKATDADRYDRSLLVSLCRQCHDHVHANPSESYATGLMVRRTP